MIPTENFLMLAVASPLATFTSYEILPVQNIMSLISLIFKCPFSFRFRGSIFLYFVIFYEYPLALHGACTERNF
jgi:hypothetical protein